MTDGEQHCGTLTTCIHALSFFFFKDTATTEIYTLSLHAALPISSHTSPANPANSASSAAPSLLWLDRKSTRLNSSHLVISYAVLRLKKNTRSQRKLDPLAAVHQGTGRPRMNAWH